MKKITILAAALLGSVYFANAQVGIGTPTPNASAMLDITATNKGVLIPRIALTDASTPLAGAATHENSLLVYNTATASEGVEGKEVKPGFYYWFNGSWERVTSQTDLENIIGETNQELENIINLLQTAYPSNNLDDSTTTGADLGGGMVYTPASGSTAAKIEYVYFNGTTYVKQDMTSLLNDLIEIQEGNVIYNPTTQVFQYWDGDSYEDISLEDIVQGFETKTSVVTIEGQQFYLAENFEGTIPATIPNPLTTGMYLIDVVGGVVNNFEEILNSNVVIEGEQYTIEEYIEYISQNAMQEGVTKIVITDGQASFQTWNNTTNEWVTVDNAVFSNIVKANESKTTVLEFPADSGKFYYISEAAIQENNGVVPTSPFTDANNETLINGVVYIDVPASVSTNFETILDQTTTIEIPGQTNQYYTVEQVIQNLIEEYSDANLPGTMVYTPGTNLTEASFTYTLADGTQSDAVSFSTLVKANESKTGFVTGTNTDGNTFIYYIGEEYLAQNDFPTEAIANGWANGATLPTTVTLLDIPQAVSTNFETILDQTTTILVPGSTTEYYTVEQVIQNIANSNGTNVGYTTVAIPADATTGQENVPENSLFYINNEGLKVVLPLGDIVYQGITQLTETQVTDVKTKLGDNFNTTNVVKTGDTWVDGKAIFKSVLETTVLAGTANITGATTTTAGFVTIVGDVSDINVIGIRIIGENGVSASATDLSVDGKKIYFRIGTGSMYNVLSANDLTVKVLVEFSANTTTP